MARLNTMYDDKDLVVTISDLLVATADSADAAIDSAVPELLSLLRQRLHMDVVFVSEFVNGQRVFRFVDSAADAPPVHVGDAGPLEESYCQRVVDGRLPGLIHDAAARTDLSDLPDPGFRVGAHLSTPIVLEDGNTYGTLCCFSTSPNENLRDRDLTNLKNCAQLVARKLDATRQQTGRTAWGNALTPPGDSARKA
ncbi:MAG: hypothetical protein RLZZ618_2534 [Pseudomonadota bacterium]|jgi:transcriptional regulator with GAF, ATPase, and Fis domain